MLRLLFGIVLVVFSAIVSFAEPRAYFTEPSLSPDRKEIAFVSGGDTVSHKKTQKAQKA